MSLSRLLSQVCSVAFALAPAIIQPHLAYAAPMLETLAYARYYNEPANPAYNICSVIDGGACDGTSLAPGTNWTVNYHSEATANFGVLRSKASLFLTGDNSLGPLNGGAVSFPSLVSIGGRGGFIDSFLIGGGSGSGVVTLSFAVAGTSSSTPGGSGRPQFQSLPVINGVPQWGQQSNYLVTNGVATIPLSFTFGQQFEFGIYFYALAQILTANGWTTGAAASADFSHTAILNTITVRDSSGNLLSDFTITSGSGTSYTPTGVVPEPGTFCLVVIGLVGLIARKRSRALTVSWLPRSK